MSRWASGASRRLQALRRRERSVGDALDEATIEYVAPVGSLSPGGSWDVLLDDRRVGRVERRGHTWTYRCFCHSLRNAHDVLAQPAKTRAEAAHRMVWHILDDQRRRSASSGRV